MLRALQVEPRLLDAAARTLLTPHAAGNGAAVRQRVELEAARMLCEALDGRCPAGALNAAEVPPRRAGAAEGAGGAPKPRTGGMLDGWWCW